MQWNVLDPAALVAELKGSLQPAIIEQVRDGSSYRCLLLNSNTMINFSLAGLQCPKMGRAAGPTGAPAGGAGDAPTATGTRHACRVCVSLVLCCMVVLLCNMLQKPRHSLQKLSTLSKFACLTAMSRFALVAWTSLATCSALWSTLLAVSLWSC